jgi:hypothetical protein
MIDGACCVEDFQVDVTGGARWDATLVLHVAVKDWVVGVWGEFQLKHFIHYLLHIL